MRRHASRRGVKVTGEADREGIEPRKLSGRVPTVLTHRQATTGIAPRRAMRVLPGVRGPVEPDMASTG